MKSEVTKKISSYYTWIILTIKPEQKKRTPSGKIISAAPIAIAKHLHQFENIEERFEGG
jgi:hypothetical protein